MSVAPKKFPVSDGAQEFINLLQQPPMEQLLVFVESTEVTGTDMTFFMHVKYESTES
jgi:hypothetical protein